MAPNDVLLTNEDELNQLLEEGWCVSSCTPMRAAGMGTGIDRWPYSYFASVVVLQKA